MTAPRPPAKAANGTFDLTVELATLASATSANSVLYEKKVLDEVKKYLVHKRRYVEIRGHTSGHLRDSVIQETNMDGSLKIRRFNKADLQRPDRVEVSNHWMLGWLRANVVREYLMAPFPDGEPGISDSRLRIRSDGYSKPMERSDRPLYDAEGEPLRAKNHRVEVILTNEVEKEE